MSAQSSIAGAKAAGCPFHHAKSVETKTVSATDAAMLAALPRPPKADGLPVLGQSFGFLRDTSALLDALYRKHGPVFRIRAGWNAFTVIAGKEARDFLASGAERHLTREAFFKPVGLELGSADFVLGVSGEKHRRLRRVLSIAYSREIASPFVPELLDIVASRVALWADGAPVDVMKEIHRLAFDLYTRMMVGGDLGAHYEDFKLLVGTNMAVGGRTMPSLAYKNPLYKRARKRILDVMWKFVQARRRTGAPPDQPTTIIDALLAVRDDEGKLLTDDEVVCYAMYGIAGSCSYMGRLIGFWLYELSKHPAVLERARTDVDAAFERGLQNATDLRSMTYLQATYLESMRYHPVSQGLPFIAAETFAFRGMRIEKGEQVVFSQIPMFQDEAPFKDPKTFDPARCLAPRNEHKKGSFHPFGMGQRSCTAQGIVEIMALATVAQILRRYELSLADPTYALRMLAMPLPAPDGFQLKVDGVHRPKPAAATADEQRIVGSFPGSDNPHVAAILAEAEHRTVSVGEVIVREGDPADALYVITEGQVSVDKADGHGGFRHVATLVEGQYFGETGLLHARPRNATVTASGKAAVQLLVLTAAQFAELVRTEDLVADEIASLVRKRSCKEALTNALPKADLGSLGFTLPEFKVESFAPGTEVIRQGEPPERFYIVFRGSAEIVVDGEVVAKATSGEFFGEIGLLLNAPRRATVRAAADEELTVVSTDRSGFQRVIDSCDTAHADLALAMSRRVQALHARAKD